MKNQGVSSTQLYSAKPNVGLGAIPSRLNQLEDAIGQLLTSISTFEEMLNPALRPLQPTPAGTGEVGQLPQVMSATAAKISDCLTGVEDAYRRIDILRSRLEL